MRYFTTIILFLAFLWASSANAQSKKITFVEHYSNTKCPNCQNSREAIYKDLDKYMGEINHMTIHYKTPYPSCPLYQYSKKEVDNRTAVYSGSTKPISGAPTLCVNSAPTSSRLLVSRIEQATEEKGVPVGLNMVEKGKASKEVDLEVANLTDADMENLYVYAALVQSVVNINVDNEDWEIHDVFRKFLGSQEGNGDAVGALKAGESKKITLNGQVPNDLDAKDLYVLAWVEQRVPDGNSYRIIMHNSVSVKTSITTGTELKIPESELSLFPNPARNELRLHNTSDFTPSLYRIFSVAGQEIKRMSPSDQINIADLTPGQYFLILENGDSRVSRKFIKQ